MSCEAVNAIVGRADQLITTLTLIILKSQNTRYQFILASISIFIKGIFIDMSLFCRLDRYADRAALMKQLKKRDWFYLG